MTLYELHNEVVVEGKIRISVWKNEEETEVVETDDLAGAEKIRPALWDMDITNMFCPGDNTLHIELDGNNEEDIF